VNPALVAGEPHFVPSTNASVWQLPLDRISIGNESLPINGTATLDSLDQGSRLSLEAAAWVAAHIPDARLENNTKTGSDGSLTGTYSLKIPCNSTTTVTIRLGDYDAVLPAPQLLIPRGWAEGHGCHEYVVLSEQNAATPALNLGLNFLQSVYTVFQFGETPAVGFAPLSDAAKDLTWSFRNPNVTIPGHSGTIVPPLPTYAPSSAHAPGANALAAVAAAACFLYRMF
jgi:hypothetical protein